MQAGGQAREGGDLAGVLEMLGVDAEGQQDGDGAPAESGYAVEQPAPPLHAGVVVDALAGLRGERLDLRIQPVDVRLDAVADGLAGGAEAVSLLRQHGLQGVDAQRQDAHG